MDLMRGILNVAQIITLITFATPTSLSYMVDNRSLKLNLLLISNLAQLDGFILIKNSEYWASLDMKRL